jgi:hypothetical protein
MGLIENVVASIKLYTIFAISAKIGVPGKLELCWCCGLGLRSDLDPFDL